MEKLEQTLGKLDQRQLVMSEEMRKFVHEIRASVGQSQSETHKHIQSVLADLARQTGALVGDSQTRVSRPLPLWVGSLRG